MPNWLRLNFAVGFLILVCVVAWNLVPEPVPADPHELFKPQGVIKTQPISAVEHIYIYTLSAKFSIFPKCTFHSIKSNLHFTHAKTIANNRMVYVLESTFFV